MDPNQQQPVPAAVIAGPNVSNIEHILEQIVQQAALNKQRCLEMEQAMMEWMNNILTQPALAPAPAPETAPVPHAPTVRLPKLATPETYNGEMHKILPFLRQCELYFLRRALEFPRQHDCIIFVMTYMKGD